MNRQDLYHVESVYLVLSVRSINIHRYHVRLHRSYLRSFTPDLVRVVPTARGTQIIIELTQSAHIRMYL